MREGSETQRGPLTKSSSRSSSVLTAQKEPAAQKTPAKSVEQPAPKAQPAQQPRAGDPDEEWFQYFSAKERDPKAVRTAVEKLFKAKKYGEVISLTEAALATGQSQVWMYDVLAYSMKLDRRDEKDIDRVMLSAIDLRGNDVLNLLLTAAYLADIGGTAPALKLYRQASVLEPSRPEPYVMGLKLAQQLKDYEAVEWAAAGILTNAWTRDREKRHRDAEDAANDAIAELKKAGRNEQAQKLQAAIVEAKRRDLIIRLEWSGTGDLDLYVDEPFKTTCSVENPLSQGGGVLVHDGLGGKNKDTYDEYVCVRGGSGEYQVRIKVGDGNIVGKQGRLIITRHAGSPQEKVEKLTVSLDKETRPVVVRLDKGRREMPLVAPVAEEQAARQTPQHEVMAKLFRGAHSAQRHVAYQFANNQGAFGNVRSVAAQTGFGVGYQPVISVINDGVTLSVAAVVSADRRYVKMAISPAFNSLVELSTFAFQTF